MNLMRSLLALASLFVLASAANAQIFLAGPGLALDIPDDSPGGVTSSITVESGDTVESVSVAVSIDHTFVGDLIWTLTSPSGTTVTLADRPGEPDQGGFGDSSDLSSAGGTGIIYDDRFPIPAELMGLDCPDTGDIVGDACPRAFAPDGALATFNGESAAGTWTLFLSDNAGADTGALDGWALVINNRP